MRTRSPRRPGSPRYLAAFVPTSDFPPGRTVRNVETRSLRCARLESSPARSVALIKRAA